MIDCITHHVCQEIQGIDEDGADSVDEEVDGEVPPQGGEAAWWRGGEAAPAWRLGGGRRPLGAEAP